MGPMETQDPMPDEKPGRQTADKGGVPVVEHSTNQNESESQTSVSNRPSMMIATGALMLVVAVILALVVWQRLPQRPGVGQGGQPEAALAAAGESSAAQRNTQANSPTNEPNTSGVTLGPLPDWIAVSDGVRRYSNLDTVIPPRERVEVITYTVKQGDTLFAIADSFGVKPETVLWGNFDVLEDNPHLLSPDQVLNILPIDGTYYQWNEGDTVDGVASFFKTDPQEILNFPGNPVDLTDQDGSYGLQAGTWVVVPDGSRPIKDWGPPAISRSNPAVARSYGPGHCGEIYSGAFGTGAFVWPTTDRSISGYHYSAIHPAIDIGGAIGYPVYASDSGVVVYAGWSNYGYGNLIVVDHGNGWQTVYAHLDTIGVTCGQSVFQGGFIGGLGTTGNSSGPHLHFEIIYNGAKPNPMDYLQ